MLSYERILNSTSAPNRCGSLAKVDRHILLSFARRLKAFILQDKFKSTKKKKNTKSVLEAGAYNGVVVTESNLMSCEESHSSSKNKGIVRHRLRPTDNDVHALWEIRNIIKLTHHFDIGLGHFPYVRCVANLREQTKMPCMCVRTLATTGTFRHR